MGHGYIIAAVESCRDPNVLMQSSSPKSRDPITDGQLMAVRHQRLARATRLVGSATKSYNMTLTIVDACTCFPLLRFRQGRFCARERGSTVIRCSRNESVLHSCASPRRSVLMSQWLPILRTMTFWRCRSKRPMPKSKRHTRRR